MSAPQLGAKRSFTGHHDLLPATSERRGTISFYMAPNTLLSWTFGRGTVIWRIWPAVLFHTLFAVAVTIVSMRSNLYLGIPNVMLTVLGVVIGFVISYRASSGYDRYWTGRTAWSDVIRNTRTLSRLIWFHIPLRLVPKTSPTDSEPRPMQEVHQVMKEKRKAIDVLEGYAVALKHHLRNEGGIYYEDLYRLSRPFHQHEHREESRHAKQAQKVASSPLATTSAHNLSAPHDPFVPTINSYGSTNTFGRGRPILRNFSRSSSDSSDSANDQTPLMPSNRADSNGIFNKVAADLIPFAHFFSKLSPSNIKKLFSRDEDEPFENEGGVQRRWALGRGMSIKHRPRVACEGENLPLEIVHYLSCWFSELEDRGTVPGTSLGPMIGTLAGLEDSISTLERILTTPLPFVFAVQIRHTVWIFLFFLPFQLVDLFQWYTIPGVAIASFIYLGFLAAGEEIEQPFGYDENDLDLDMFCQEIIHVDIERLKRTPGPNVFLGSHHGEEHVADPGNSGGKQPEATAH